MLDYRGVGLERFHCTVKLFHISQLMYCGVGYIDLSKRRVSPEDIQRCEEKYNKAKTVNSILRRVAENLEYTNEQLEDLYERTAWKLEEGKPPSSSYEVFKKAVV